MAKIISQETFDGVVMENIVEFSMTPIEAKEETISQFEAQGINLANIIKDLLINEESGRPLLTEAIDSIKAHISGETVLDATEIVGKLSILESECKKSIPHRVLAGKSGAHEILISLLEEELSKPTKNREISLGCFNAANALTHQQPDLFDAEALVLAIKTIRTEKDKEILIATLQWIGKACIMHEYNRQNIMNAEIMTHLKPLVTNDPIIIRDVCSVFRNLILDDDIRVDFGKAHDHARLIASEILIDLTKLIPEFDDPAILSDLILTIATLAVRQELCGAIEEASGLEYVFDVLKKYPDHLKINRESIKLFRALAGNDTTKVHIVQKGAAPIIQKILNNYKAIESVASVALACISTLTLRVKENSVAFFEAGAAETIADAMQCHPSSKIVQRNGAWAIRNMVSRSRDQCEAFLLFGVEDVLNEAMTNHPSIQQDIKAALRDLGCKVDLKEEWTGKAEKQISY